MTQVHQLHFESYIKKMSTSSVIPEFYIKGDAIQKGHF